MAWSTMGSSPDEGMHTDYTDKDGKKRGGDQHQKKPTNRWKFAMYIGLYAGLIWGALKLVEFAIHFTEVVPGFLLEPFFQHAYLVTYSGIVLGYISFIILSVLASLIYVLLLRKLPGPWPGIGYGIAWWGMLYLLIGPLTEMVPSIRQLDLNSFVSDLSLFTLWGLFIGYSISMEYTDDSKYEPTYQIDAIQ